jgi:hypothetical protein
VCPEHQISGISQTHHLQKTLVQGGYDMSASSGMLVSATISAFIGSLLVAPAMADCSKLPGFAKVQAALKASTKPSGGDTNGGLDLNMWASVVDRDGTVCVVAFTGKDRGAQWPGSRVISAQKANTANAFSLDSLALSTANLFSAVQPGGSLYGLQQSSPLIPRSRMAATRN